LADDGNLDRLVGIVSRADVSAGLSRGLKVDLSAITVPPAYCRECHCPERS
jgi:hypothetical protein